MIVVDNTILAATQTCDTFVALRYVLHHTMPEDAAPLVCGQWIHTAFETWFKASGGTTAALAAFETGYRPWAAEHIIDERDRFQYDNVVACLRQWFATHPIASLPFTTDPSLIEVGFALPLADDIVFVGRMDALVWDTQGVWYVVDHKSTYKLDDTWRRTHRAGAQLTGYILGGQQHLNAPVVGAYVNGIEISRLPSDPVRKCRDHGVKYAECGIQHARSELLLTQRTPHQIDQWRQGAIALARKFAAIRDRVHTIADIQQVEMTGQFTGACARCQFYEFCALGRPLDVAAAIMRTEPWEPYTRVFGQQARPQ